VHRNDIERCLHYPNYVQYVRNAVAVYVRNLFVVVTVVTIAIPDSIFSDRKTAKNPGDYGTGECDCWLC